MNDKLRACMCGSTDLEILHSATYYVWCHKCFAKGSPCTTKEEAVSSWNTRPVEDALIEACEEAWNDLETAKYDEYGNPRYHLDTIDRLLVAIARAKGEA